VNFDTAFNTLIDPQHEGGFQNNPKDPGNWTGGAVGSGVLKGTKYGISAASYPHLDIANLTIEQAKAIYLPDYWLAAGCDKAPDAVRYSLFDTAVNSGVGTAKVLLQRAVDVAQDGLIGPVTLAAMSALNPYQLAARFEGARLMRDTQLNNWTLNSKGWTRRSATNLLAL